MFKFNIYSVLYLIKNLYPKHINKSYDYEKLTRSKHFTDYKIYNGHYANKKILNITNHQENVNTTLQGLKLKTDNPNNAMPEECNMYNQFIRICQTILKVKPYDPTTLLLDIYKKNTNTCPPKDLYMKFTAVWYIVAQF